MASGKAFGDVVVETRRRIQQAVATFFAPMVSWLAGRGVLPDHITWSAFALAAAAAVFAGFRVFFLAGILFLLSGIADLVDGALARRAGTESRGGAFLDSLLDRAGEGLVHAGAAVAFAFWGLWPGVLAVALSLTGSYLTSYARARAEGLGISLEEAWVSRGERVVVIGLGMIFHFALIAFWLIAVAAWATAAQRAIVARRRLGGAKVGPKSASAPDVSSGTSDSEPDDP